jgi:hypothetical protein
MKQTTIFAEPAPVYGRYDFKTLPPTWKFVSTPSHGYLYPSDEHNRNVPSFIRDASYEEDCAFNIPIVFNPHLFTEETVKAATDSFKNWFPEEYEKAFNVVLQPGESHQKDQNYYRRVNSVGKFEKASCWGDWYYDIPRGFVYAILTEITTSDVKADRLQASGRAITVLLTEKQYEQKEPYSLADLTEYRRDNSYHTWSDYEEKTGKGRYK